jgi:hypothetical protein
MRYARLGFHVLMLVLLVSAFAGVFSPPRTGNFAQDNGGWIFPAIGVGFIWVIGAIILRVIARLAR